MLKVIWYSILTGLAEYQRLQKLKEKIATDRLFYATHHKEWVKRISVLRNVIEKKRVSKIDSTLEEFELAEIINVY